MDIDKAVDFLVEYWSTYKDQEGYKDYNESTFLNDALYGIGAAMGDEYKFAPGYLAFRKRVQALLKELEG